MASRTMALGRGTSVAAIVVLLAASAAFAGKLPGSGDWSYDNTARMNAVPGVVEFRAYLRVASGKASIYSFNAIVIGGKCTMKNGHVVPDSLVGGSVVRTQIPVKADGSFRATRTALGDSGGKGTLLVKGVFTGTRVSGTVTAHMHDPNWGDCKGTGRFVRAVGVRIA